MFDLLQQLTQITSGRRGQKLLREIGLMGSYWAKQSDEQLHRASLSLRYRAQCGEPLESLLSAAYSLVRTASDRVLGMRHYDTQVLAGIVLQQRAIAEMQTGEGKTLTAMLPAYLHSLRGQGVHLATANDYLAVRDSTLVRPVMELLGMSVGVVDSTTPRSQRALAYRCDITYGTAREFGFDFLRDQMLHPARQASRPGWVAGWLGSQSQTDRRVQRELNFTIVDEADCILIDEARTPLVLATSRATDEQVRCAFQWSASVASQFEPETHFEFDPSGTQISLTSDGRTLARKLLPPGDIPDMGLFEVYEYVERAIQAWRLFQRDRHYVVRKNEVVIVDEFTGRLSEGRQWRDGLHQAMEAKECLPIHVMTGELARISLQSFFRQYRHVAGMTGTAWSARREFRQIYQLDVVTIPTHRPSRREVWPDAVFGSSDERWQAVVQEVRRIHLAGRPVLIGTRSIDKSEHLSALFQQAGVAHCVLNARQSAAEAEIVAAAGRLGQVTVATNMAGRGTDIGLADEVLELGGLHVIGTELHESARIDRQLSGRCGRQGDPGSFHQFMSLDDDIVKQGLGEKGAQRLRDLGQRNTGKCSRFAAKLRSAQKNVERQYFKQRRLLMFVEQERQRRQSAMGQDPYLDCA